MWPSFLACPERSRRDHSRIAFSALYPDEKQVSVIAFLHAALAYYARLGIRFKAILTDNGPAYRSHAMAAACRALGLKHRFTRPYTPRTNGKAERFIQTALREWAYARSYSNSNERSQVCMSLLESMRCIGSPVERRTTDMQTTRSFVGMDVHKETISISVAEDGRNGTVRFLGVIPNQPDDIAKMAKRLSLNAARFPTR